MLIIEQKSKETRSVIKEGAQEIELRSLAYDVSRLLGVNLVETRLVYKNGLPHQASRYLANAADTPVHTFEGSFGNLFIDDMSRAWVFNYLMGASHDLQYTVTPKGHGVLIDYPVNMKDRAGIHEHNSDISLAESYRRYVHNPEGVPANPTILRTAIECIKQLSLVDLQSSIEQNITGDVEFKEVILRKLLTRISQIDQVFAVVLDE